MSPARFTARHARLYRAAHFQVESLERRVLLSSAIAAFGAQQTFAVGAQPRSVAVADVNVDGKPDLIVANAVSNTVSVLLGNGNGTFQNQLTYATGASPFAVAVADVNGDGKPDLIVADSGSNSVSVLLGNGNGTFQNQLTFATGAGPRSLAIADLNGDGKPDIIVGDYSANAVSVLLGNGDGTFQPQQTYATGTQPRSIAIADVNIDGKPDLIVANHGSNSVSVLLNSGTGTFPTQTTYATGTSPFSVATADVNVDGKPDILVANNGSNSVSVLLNSGTGTFQPQQTFAAGAGPIAIAASDINGDGKPDLVVADYNANTASVLLGNGDGTFQPQKTFAVGTGPRSIAVADLTDDGREDLIVGNSAANSASVLLGDVPPTVLSIDQASPPGPITSDGSVTYTVTFNEPVTGVDPTDFALAATGTVTATTPFSVSGSGATYTVNITGIAGAGTLGLDLVDNGSITDAAGNGLGPGDAVPFQSEQTVAAASGALLAADLNGDGKPDLIVTGLNSNIDILLANGNGTFATAQSLQVPYPNIGGVTVADVNGDGKPDLIVVDSDNAGNSWALVFLGNGNGTFQPAQTFVTQPGAFGVIAADVNGNGKPDLISSYHGFASASGISVLQGNGDGTFQRPIWFAASSPCSLLGLADVNGDGKPDVIVSSYGSIGVFLGNGNGTFQFEKTFAVPGLGGATINGGAVVDVNGDGKPDIILSLAGAIGVLLGNGNGTFSSAQTFATGIYGSGFVGAADINGDGKIDVEVDGTHAVSTLLGNGDGTFQRPQTASTSFNLQGAALADVDGDGRLELLIKGGGIEVFANNAFPSEIYTIVPTVDTVSLAVSNDNISLKKNADGTDIDWTLGFSAGQFPINDPNGLTIIGDPANDTVTLDYTNGDPLPGTLHLNGTPLHLNDTFTIEGIQGTNPLAGTTLEIGKCTVFIAYSSADPIATIQSYLQNGYNAGGWDGTPTASTGVITSTAAQANPGYMIGYADSRDGTRVNTTTNTIELKYTLGGDLNLAGTVNFSDFALVVANYGKAESWDGGAITYGATVSFADFALTVANYGKQAITSTALSASALNAASTPLASDPPAANSSHRLLPTVDPAGSTDPVVHPLHPSKSALRKRR